MGGVIEQKPTRKWKVQGSIPMIQWQPEPGILHQLRDFPLQQSSKGN